MKNNIPFVKIILITFLLLFATTFLLDIEIIQQNTARTILVWLLLGIELISGSLLFILEIQKK